MRFNFLIDQGIEVGSSRVHGYLLHEYLLRLGCNSVINNPVESKDIVVFSKNYKLSKMLDVISSCPSAYYLDTNPSRRTIDKRKKRKFTDAAIVGSITEFAEYVSDDYPVVIMPQIEDQKLFDNVLEVDRDSNALVIGYHGNKQHVLDIPSEFVKAIDEFSERSTVDVIFRAIYNVASEGNIKSPFSKAKFEVVQWDYDFIHEEIKKFDIGYVPALTRYKKGLEFRFVEPLTRFIFKNNTNPGRLYTYFQARVPVIADFSPYHFVLGHDGRSGFLCGTYQSYLSALYMLQDEYKRREVSNNAYSIHSDSFCWKKNTEHFVEQVKKIIDKSKRLG